MSVNKSTKQPKFLLMILMSMLFLSGLAAYTSAQKRETSETSPKDWRYVLSLFFLTRSDGWLVDSQDENIVTSTIYATVDGGQTWRKMGRLPFRVSKIQFVDSHHGWVTSTWSRSVGRTTDGGASWRTSSLAGLLKGPGRSLNGGTDELVAYSQQSAWIILNDQLFTTNNAGATWETRQDTESFTSITRASDSVGFALSVKGTIYRTEDSGARWAPLKSRFLGSAHALDGIPDRDAHGFIRFSDPTHGWLFLWHRNEPTVVCFQTDDGGRTWFEANVEAIRPDEVVSVHDVQVRGYGGWTVANTLAHKTGVIQRYYVLGLNDGRWVSCGQADTLSSIRVFAGAPGFALVLDGRNKIVEYQCAQDSPR